MNNASVYISGILGTVGRSLAVMLKQAGFEVAGFDPAVRLIEGNSPPLEFPVYLPGQMEEALTMQSLEKPMVLVIFNNNPAAAVEQAELAAANGVSVLVATTGFNAAQTDRLMALAGEVSIIVSSNLSLAVNLMFSFAEKARAVLGPEYEVTIIETHHNRKKDRPSGTAKKLAEAAGIDPAGGSVHSIRSGDVVGDHELILIGPYDRLVIGHFAQKRELFCAGAVTAVQWLLEQDKPGWYTMKQVFGL